MQASDTFRRVVPGSPYFYGILLIVLLGITFVFSLYMEFVNFSLLQIGLSPKAASIALAGIVVGGFINVPIHRTRFSQLQLAEWASCYTRNSGGLVGLELGEDLMSTNLFSTA